MSKRLADAFALAKLIEGQGSRHKATLADALMEFWDVAKEELPALLKAHVKITAAQDRHERKLWLSADGRITPYNEIETRHLRNIINYIDMRCPDDFRLPELRRELQRRR